jgi:hypothetical protein
MFILPGNALGMIERIKSNNALKDDPIERAKRVKSKICDISHGYKHNAYNNTSALSLEELEILKCKIRKQARRERIITIVTKSIIYLIVIGFLYWLIFQP